MRRKEAGGAFTRPIFEVFWEVSLIELKLAARRLKDFADVLELIRFNGLDEGFAANLHPSVRPDYIECLEEKRREGSLQGVRLRRDEQR